MTLENSKIKKLLLNPNRSSDWITPKEYTDALTSVGNFNLDPCASLNQKWHHASINWTIKEDGLKREWIGRVWLNPPYSENKLWMKRMADHDSGISLVPARTDTKWFQDYVFSVAKGIIFLKGRIKFYGSEGYAAHSCTFPVCFVAYGVDEALLLYNLNLNNKLFDGYYIDLESF